MCVRGLDGANTNTRMVQASRDFCSSNSSNCSSNSSNWNNSNRAAAVPLSLALNHLQPPGFASLLSGFSHPSGEMDFFFFFLKKERQFAWGFSLSSFFCLTPTFPSPHPRLTPTTLLYFLPLSPLAALFRLFSPNSP